MKVKTDLTEQKVQHRVSMGRSQLSCSCQRLSCNLLTKFLSNKEIPQRLLSCIYLTTLGRLSCVVTLIESFCRNTFLQQFTAQLVRSEKIVSCTSTPQYITLMRTQVSVAAWILQLSLVHSINNISKRPDYQKCKSYYVFVSLHRY